MAELPPEPPNQADRSLIGYIERANKAPAYNSQHVYVSTYCIHNAHDACRQTCKTCQAPCRCQCHG